jgi:hypothetical protein
MEFLKGFIDGETSPRFSDISHYARLENNKMRDCESQKNFTLNRFTTQIFINEHKINPESLTADTVFSIPTQHCYCLCLTSRGNEPELFETFEADTCIEIDVEKLTGVLGLVFSQKLKGAHVESRNVTYYDPEKWPETTNPIDLVFYKPMSFSHEAEFRISIFYPENKTGFKADNGEVIPFSLPDESMHMSFIHPDKSVFKQCIVNVSAPFSA